MLYTSHYVLTTTGILLFRLSGIVIVKRNNNNISSIAPESLETDSDIPLLEIEIDAEVKQLKAQNQSAATGPDELLATARVLKEVAQETTPITTQNVSGAILPNSQVIGSKH